MKPLIPAILLVLAFPSCQCPKNPDGTKSGPCVWQGPSIQASFGYNGASFGLTLFGEPSLPTIVIPINKHDPLPIYPEPVAVTPTK